MYWSYNSEKISKKRIVDIINSNIDNKVMHIEQLEEDLLMLGYDSIDFIYIVASLENEFKVEIPDEKLLFTEMNTVSKIMDAILYIYGLEKEK